MVLVSIFLFRMLEVIGVLSVISVSKGGTKQSLGGKDTHFWKREDNSAAFWVSKCHLVSPTLPLSLTEILQGHFCLHFPLSQVT